MYIPKFFGQRGYTKDTPIPDVCLSQRAYFVIF